MITANVDLKEFEDALHMLAAATDRELKEVTKEQAKLLVRDAQAGTWPLDRKGFAARSEKEVRARVLTPESRDVRVDRLIGSRLNRVAEVDFSNKFRDQKLAQRIDKLYFANRYDILTKIFRDAESKKYIAVEGAVTLEQLRGARHAKQRLVVERESKVNAVLALIKKEQGKSLSGWNAAAQALGRSLSALGRKHGMKFGSVEIREMADQYFVKIVNTAPLIEAQESKTGLIQSLVNKRTRAMVNNANKAIEYAAKKSGFKT